MIASGDKRARLGIRPKRWAEMHCDRDLLENVVLPTIADLQFEDATAPPSVAAHWFLRVRAYVGLAQALALHSVTQGSASMDQRKLVTLLRLSLAVPAALLASLAAQPILFQVMSWVLQASVGRADWTIWGARCLMFLFMGAGFVAGAWFVAPPTRKPVVMVTAFSLVVLWSAVLMIHYSAYPGPRFYPWYLAMGPSLLLGGTLALWTTRRSLSVSAG